MDTRPVNDELQQQPHENPPHKQVPLTRLAGIALYIGIAGYGGGPAIIGLMQQFFVERCKWVSEEDFFTGLSLSQLLPGANALSVMEFLGYQVRGSLGALIAPVFFLFPAFVLMTVLSAVYFRFGQLPLVQALFTGLAAAVVALVANAMVVLGRTAIKDKNAVLIAAIAFLTVLLLNTIHFPMPILVVVVVSAFLGLLLNKPVAPADAQPEPTPHARSPWWFWPMWIAACAAIAIIIVVTYRTQGTQLFLALFRVGLFTFGGGFSSIPLYQHEAVELHHWVTQKEFLAGIALGQITPGPVLITGTFIGYRVLGIWGALLGTIAVFLPGALGMFFLAHQHERLQQLTWLQSMVRGVVAGFIGVIFNITLQFAYASIFPDWVFNWRAALITAVALYVLLVAKKDPLWVILGTVVVSPFLFR